MNPQIINIAYIVSAVIFILGIKMLGKAESARKGNILSSVGMLVAVVFTLFDHKILDASDKITWVILAAGLLLGAVIGLVAAKKVKMTSMPEMVALLNGFGGLASLLVAWVEYHYDGVANIPAGVIAKSAIIVTILIGGVTFTGSAYAWAKLSGKLSGKPYIYAGQKIVNLVIAVLTVVSAVAFAAIGDYWTAYYIMVAAIILSLVLGIAAVMPIGGGDMPVVISLLNSLSGLAASAAGFVIQNNVLIVAGSLVGASGVILTVIMCKSMNRTLSNVLFSGFGSAAGGSKNKVEGEMKAISADDAYYILGRAERRIHSGIRYGCRACTARRKRARGNSRKQRGGSMFCNPPCCGKNAGAHECASRGSRCSVRTVEGDGRGKQDPRNGGRRNSNRSKRRRKSRGRRRQVQPDIRNADYRGV